MQWLTIVAQSDSTEPIESPIGDDNAIIEIPEATLQAIQEADAIEAITIGEPDSKVISTESPEVVCGSPTTTRSVDAVPSDRIANQIPMIDQDTTTANAEPRASDTLHRQTSKVDAQGETSNVANAKDADAKDLETKDRPSTDRLALSPSAKPRESSSRQLRTPRPLVDADDDESTAPKALSDSIKSQAKEPPPTRSLKSSDEDMKAYLAQEEPTASSVHNSADDAMQGVDALQAAKPDAGQPSSAPVRAPIVVPDASQRALAALSPAMQRRLQRVEACVDHYLKNPETTTARSPWAVMHAILPYGADYELIGPNGRVNAIGWMCHNGLCRTQRIFTPRGNSFVPNVGGGVQGHEGQFLAILAQCQVPLDYPIQIGNRKFNVEDLVRYEMATCKEKSELTFKLIGLSYYVDSNKQWRSNDGKVWSIQKLVQEELEQPIVGSACGGTHRLMGFSFSIRQRELQGQPINGQFARAAKFVNEYIRYTWQLQNPDGSFSTDWYEGRANEPNDERKVQTTGHMLEWLMFTVGDEELKSQRVERAIDFLLSHIYDHRDHKWPIGPRGHATRALALYKLRMEALQEQRTTGSATPTITQAPNASSTPIVDARSARLEPTGRPPASTSTVGSGVRNPNGVTTQSTPRTAPSQPASKANPRQPSRSTQRANRQVRG